MRHIKDQYARLGLTKKRTRAPKPFDRFTKTELWDALLSAEGALETIALRANTLGRDSRRGNPPDASDRAYKLRDLARAHNKITTP